MSNLGNFSLPNVSESDFEDKKRIREILEHLYALNEQLRYMLNHLDEDNFTEDFKEKVDGGEKIGAIIERVENTENNASAVRKMAEDIIAQYVKKGEVISAIEQTAETIRIAASRIQFEGATTINNNFSIDTDSYMRVLHGGTLGAFTIVPFGLFGGDSMIKVGGITISGNTISGVTSMPGFLIKGAQLSKSNYDGGQASVLAVDTSNNIVVASLVLLDQYGQPAPYQIVLRPPDYVPPPPDTGTQVSVVEITQDGDRLTKRSGAGTEYNSLGTCYAGEIYGCSGTTIGTDGYVWARCDQVFQYNSGTGRWVGYAITPFYARQYSADGRSYWVQSTVTI